MTDNSLSFTFIFFAPTTEAKSLSWYFDWLIVMKKSPVASTSFISLIMYNLIFGAQLLYKFWLSACQHFCCICKLYMCMYSTYIDNLLWVWPVKNGQILHNCYTSVTIGSHRFKSVQIGWHRLTSVDIGWHRFTLVQVGSHRITSVHIGSRRFTSDHIRSHQFTSVHIGSHWFTSIKKNIKNIFWR